MENKKANYSIACTVTQCAHHCKDVSYCALERIKVGTHESDPKAVQCTDCESFVLSKGCSGNTCG